MSGKTNVFSNQTKEKYLTAFLMGFFCLLISVIPVMIADGGYFIYYGDFNAQQIPFYNLANDAVRNGQFGWNWFTDLGSDLMNSYSFYLIGSPFFWLSTLIPRSLVTLSMPFLLALKHGVASLTAYAYIRRFVRSKNASLVGALLYTFSGFQVYNIFFNHFQDVTAFFPLMLIAMEENINHNRKGVFAVADNPKIQQEVLVTPGRNAGAKIGQFVEVKITHWPVRTVGIAYGFHKLLLLCGTGCIPCDLLFIPYEMPRFPHIMEKILAVTA